jgi:adenine specific DNA methylase Mod
MVKARENTIKNVSEKEKRFHDVLEDIFIGASIEGKSGFINLMRIKSSYFRFVLSQLEEDVSRELEEFPEFREELFDKLYNFFKRYFSESGSIHFAFTPIQENVWERVYTDKDTSLFWKTRNLYYVKTDRIWRSMNVKVNDFNFFFDASEIEHRKAYEKREIIYELRDVSNDDTINFKVLYSERGRKTDVDEILRKLSKRNVSEEILEKAFRIFEKQNEVDYFINKDANSFLKEQFNVWLRHYLMDEKSIFNERRLKQLKALRNIAFKIIDFISQFEDELRKVWEKPKFVLNSNYVITLNKIKELCGEAFLEDYVVSKVLKNEKQLQEWKELFGVDVKNETDLIEKNTLQGKEWKKLPIDTKNFDEEFKWRLIERVCENHELDNVLDGWLIKSENWQALNTILPKFRGKIQTIYIDPPFNKEQNADYFYHIKYKDSTWITMLENRLQLAREILNNTGCIFVRCDYNGDMYVRLLMNEIFGEENFRNEIIVSRTFRPTEEINKYHTAHDILYLFSKSESYFFKAVVKPRENPKWRPMHLPGERWSPIEPEYIHLFSKENLKEKDGKIFTRARIILGKEMLPPEGRHWALSQKDIFELEKVGGIKLSDRGEPLTLEEPFQKLTDNWTDITGYSALWSFPTENSEILLKRVIESTSNEGDLVMDFFLGIGTTIAVAHKLKRKWIGIEIGMHFYRFETNKGPSGVLVRMKEVLAGKGNHEPCGISKEVNWQGGGFFKYYELEQYEQALNNAVYKDTHPFVAWASKDVYNHYVFLKDEKMLRAMEIDYQNKNVKIDLSKLYSDIDTAETLSNLKGKWIKRLTRNKVEFEDGEIIDLENLDWKLIKPLIWW